MNTVWHLSAAFWARIWKELFMQDKIVTHDWHDIKLNIQHAINIKETDSNEILKELIKLSKSSNIEVSEFTREMIETTDDKKVSSITLWKTYDEIEYMWILLFWDKKIIDDLTKGLGLYK